MANTKYWTGKVTVIAIFIILGLFVGQIVWHFIPINGKLDVNKHYLLVISQAEDMAQKGNTSDAIAALRSAIDLNSTRYEAYLFLGDIFLSRGETNAAVTNYDAALIYCGNSPTNLFSRQTQYRERTLIVKKIDNLKESWTVRSNIIKKP